MDLKGLLKDSAPFAIRVMWVCLMVGPTAWLVVTSIKSIVPIDSSEMAAWVQAVGSIGAILGAVWISRQQHQKEDARRAKEEADQFLKLVGVAAWAVESMRQTLEHVEFEGARLSNHQRHLSLLEEIAEVLKAVDINSIHDVELATRWTQLGQVFFDFIREGKKGDSIELLRVLRVSNMRRIYDQAIKILNNIYVSQV